MDIGSRVRLATLLGVIAVLGTGCTNSALEVRAFATGSVSELPPTPSTVPVTLYFRSPARGAARLVPVPREVVRGDEPARLALEMLLTGPRDSEGLPVFPPGVTVRRFQVKDQVASVALDGDFDGMQPPDEGDPHGGLLSLAALANTLTEFPSISAVQLRTLSDHPSTAFGGWGIPPLLVRDESFIEPVRPDETMESLANFSTAAKVVPASADVLVDREAPLPRVAGVHVSDRLAYVRIVVELASADPTATEEPKPLAEAVAIGNLLRLSIGGVEASTALPPRVDGPGGAVSDVAVRPGDDELVLNIRTETLRVHPFSLLTDVNPARIILDVKK